VWVGRKQAWRAETGAAARTGLMAAA
jgi:hypothetical protein